MTGSTVSVPTDKELEYRLGLLETVSSYVAELEYQVVAGRDLGTIRQAADMLLDTASEIADEIEELTNDLEAEIEAEEDEVPAGAGNFR